MAQASDFGARIKKIIEEDVEGENLDAKIKNLGTSSTSLYSYFSGKSYPSIPFLIKLHEKTRVNLDWLITGEGEPYNIKNIELNTTILDFIAAKIYVYIKNEQIQLEQLEFTAKTGSIYNFLLKGEVTGEWFKGEISEETLSAFGNVIDYLLPVIFEKPKKYFQETNKSPDNTPPDSNN